MHPFELLDYGAGRRLDRIGPWLVDRPAPYARGAPVQTELWPPAHAVYTGTHMSRGNWQIKTSDLPVSLTAQLATSFPLFAELQFSASGQLGIFGEHQKSWELVHKRCDPPLQILNLFGYTGLATAAALLAGHSVCHVDAGRSVVQWARRNAALNQCDQTNVRWIVDDALEFCKREVHRQQRYDGFIVDPPAFGRFKKHTWQIKRDLPRLLAWLGELARPKLRFLVLSHHSLELKQTTVQHWLQDAFGAALTRQFQYAELQEESKYRPPLATGKGWFLCGQ
ncbi:MAG: class I SAM-dependent methyltransferase [Leptospiraceae bacterium]|nr:class I SAM-dependent methyltransferase [Leptospiraceae bacterium]